MAPSLPIDDILSRHREDAGGTEPHTADEAWILHSSAALGSALYLPGDGIWELWHRFDWYCRSATDDSARVDLLDREAWQANNSCTGDDGIVEYEVTLPWDGAAVAVSYPTDSETAAFWPADLSTEARDQVVGPCRPNGVTAPTSGTRSRSSTSRPRGSPPTRVERSWRTVI